MKTVTLYSEWEVNSYTMNNPSWAIVSITPLKKDQYVLDRVGDQYVPSKSEVVYAYTVILQEIK